MTSNHTPGPWYATDNGRDPPFVTDAHGDEILASWENARLIAAAPDLLDALETLIAPWNAGRRFADMDADVLRHWQARANAAIAKARGEN